MNTKKYIYAFEEGDGKNKILLGGKGAGLCEMTQIGLNVPPGFTVTTEACLAYLESNHLADGLMDELRGHMAALEKKTGKGFGSGKNPLLISVRSGSAMSMPGMMDTILNLGLNETSLQGLIKQTANPRFAYDAYRRFIQLFGKIALGIDDEHFDDRMAALKRKHGARLDLDLSAEHLRELAGEFLEIVKRHTGKPFPQDPYEQLEISVGAVFRSWMGKRAVDYRRQFKITKDMANGTAVSVCTMVFGNMGSDSGTGVGFTRNPGTGENVIYGEYLVNAQGEDVVAGIRTPKPIAEMEQEMPEIYRQLMELHNRLESHYHEVQDFEFTIERGTLYCLQTRNGKMNARGMVRSSVEMFQEGLISKERALLRIEPPMLEQLLVPQLSPNFHGKSLAQGLPASPGAASGKIVFDANTAEARGNAGEKVILVREETKPDDIHGFFRAQGILTSRGGKTSHAAVVARGMGKPCVSGCEQIVINDKARSAVIGETTLHEGDVITIDGGTGHVYAGEVPTVEAEFSEEMGTLLAWADQVAQLKVMANADTPEDAIRAREFGAVGIGLVRTERMFNSTDRLPIMQEMILAETVEERQSALDRLMPIQRSDFKGIFKAMKGLPVTIRLLDPPMHEFLPTAAQLELEIAHLHSGMLGSDRSMVEMTLLGGIQGAGVPSSTLASTVPEAHILELPFLFRDRDEAYYLIDNVIAPILRKKLAAKGFVTSAFMENGFMEFVMRYPVRKPEDLAKCKIGSWEIPVHVAFLKAVGGNPIPIPPTEVFNAYARGMVDSGANSISALIAWDKLFGGSLRRDQIYITPIRFSYQAGVLVLNKSAWDKLPADLRPALQGAMDRLTRQIRNNLRDALPDNIAQLRKLGYHFVSITDEEKKSFEKSAKKVYREFEPIVGRDFLRKVLAARARYRREHPSGGQ
ncbi:MAG: pyruvate, phosphate dikinase [Betaproteobacteria bacterium]|nr:pyruvate, phosphate dikinase [Betaproteobacteria bacterium]